MHYYAFVSQRGWNLHSLTLTRKSAFSLVELSIVLVILGLLVGGILSGRSLIRASELRSAVAQYQKYLSATIAFRDKYLYLPGDMPNATQFWGLYSATPATCAFGQSTDTKTCNGDGSGILNNPPTAFESRRFWQHLANAGFIEGTYDGVYTEPYSRVSSVSMTWSTSYFGRLNGSWDYFDGDYGHVLGLGMTIGIYNTTYKFFLPEEVWSLDTKMDDGKPATGKLVVDANGTVDLCTDTSSMSTLTANYLLTGGSNNCGFMFRNQF